MVSRFGVAFQQGFIPGRRTAGEAKAEEQRAEATPSAARRQAPPGIGLALLVGVVILGGASLALATVVEPRTVDVWALAILVGLAVIAERSDLSLYGSSRVSLTFIPIFASIALWGMTGLPVVVTAAVVASSIGHGRPLHKTAFNFGTLMLAGAASAGVLELFGSIDYLHDWPRLLGPTLLAGGANFAVNSALVAAAIALTTRSDIRSVWKENFVWLWPHYLVLAVLAVAIVAAYESLGVWGIAVFLAPPVMMRLSIKQYLNMTTKSVVDLRVAHGDLQTAHEQVSAAVASLGNAYDGTLRSLMKALDARDSDTAGHSERVADLTMAMAAEIGIPQDSDQWRYISWGALLHDVGKIAIADGILRKPGSLTDEEWESMRTHAQAGFDILQSVDFLAPAGEIVLAHHERFDGQGYPRGLAGEDIPLGARIFAIADAFDAMTSTRSYRSAFAAEQALAEILRHSGTQFDPAAVRAFLSVYQKRFVGIVHHEHVDKRRSLQSHKLELSTSAKRAIIGAAGMDNEVSK